MSFGGKDKWFVHMVQRVFGIEKEKQILSGLSQKEALHSITELAAPDILKPGPAALGPAPPFQVPEYHFPNMQIPGIPSRPIEIECRFGEFGTATIP